MEYIKEKIRVFFDGTPFKITYFLLTMASFNSLTTRQSYMLPFTILVFLMGSCLLFYRLIQYKNFIRTPHFLVLVGFVASMITTALYNYKYGVVESAQLLVWTVFQFGLLYVLDETHNRQKVQREFFLISHILLIYVFISVVASFIIMLTGTSFSREADGIWFMVGFFWGRLFGVYVDPNYGSIYGCVAIILCLYFMSRKQKAWNIFYTFNIIFQFLYIVFSDSRTGLISLMVSLPLYVFLKGIKKDNSKSKKIISTVLLPIGMIILIIVGYVAVRNGYNTSLQQGVENETKTNHPIVSESDWDNSSDIEKNISEAELGRPQEDTSKTDISNRRFSIWKSGLEIFSKSPIIGVGFRNLVSFSLDRLPETYIVNNDFVKFESLHNIFFDVLASQGIVGMIFFVLFVVLTLKYIIQFLYQYFSKLKKEEYHYFITLLSAIVSIAISTLFYSEILYINSVGSFLFWCFLGYIVHFIATYRKISELELESENIG